MRSIRSVHFLRLVIGATLAASLTGCGSSSAARAADPGDSVTLPVIEAPGSRAHAYESLDELAAISSALVIARPTGVQSTRALPAEQGGTATSGPTVYVEMRVSQVLSGTVTSELIEVVSPGTDAVSGKPALRIGGPFLMYLAPAMYGANAPAGGFVISGGPAGVYGFTGVEGEFGRVDTGSPGLPARINDVPSLPRVTRTVSELLAQGPR